VPTDDLEITIAIPTFDRPRQLRRCVQLLSQQTERRFSLLILDNASPLPVEEVLHDLLPAFPQVRIIRNRLNVGGDVNIMRCFEFCETEYIWVLGDDDEPVESAIATVLATLQRYPNALFLNFQCELYQRSQEKITEDLDSFIDSIDSYSNVLFISTSVFRRSAVTPFIPWAYHYMYSMACQLVLVFRALEASPGICVLSTERIVRWSPPPEGVAWAAVRQMLGLGILLDLPLSARGRARLAQLLSSPRALEYLTVHLLGYLINSGNRARAYHAMEQMYCRLLVHSGSWTIRLRYFFYRFVLFKSPRLGVAIFRTVSRATGRGALAFDFRDPFR
jgi:glycosyltransferase involved in cell wall biosynthesis